MSFNEDAYRDKQLTKYLDSLDIYSDLIEKGDKVLIDCYGVTIIDLMNKMQGTLLDLGIDPDDTRLMIKGFIDASFFNGL